MSHPMFLMRSAVLALVLTWSAYDGPFFVEETEVAFDLPPTIECRDVTPAGFARAHPDLKIVEGKFRISARLLSGREKDIVDFMYVLASPNARMRFHDYLPNTTLESTVVDDEITVSESAEKVNSIDGSIHVGYKSLGFGLGKTRSDKNSRSNQYKQIAPKSLVVASGTTNREHGIFFKLKPSQAASLEGAKEFTFLAAVPKAWRGDWCTVSCAARAESQAFFSRAPVRAGLVQAQIGLYLTGDGEAAKLARELADVQQAHAAELAQHLATNGDELLQMMHAGSAAELLAESPLCGVFTRRVTWGRTTQREALEAAQAAVADLQLRLSELSQ